jgi:H+/Na+-translocating ferredoxin:NAD+ oxidoreductase subunit G
MRDKILYMVVFLGLVSAIAGAALSGVKSWTDPIIEKGILEKKIKPSLDLYMKPVGVENDFIADRIKLDLGKDEKGRKMRLTVFKGKKGGKVVAAALETAAGGFGGDIKVLTIFDLENKKILGVKTLDQKETKGLGARVADDTEKFIKQWAGMDYSRGAALKANGGSVDAISGATVSSTGFTAAVNKAVELLEERADEITK